MSNESPHPAEPDGQCLTKPSSEASQSQSPERQSGEAEPAPRTDLEATWCRQRIDRSDDAAYVHLIRDAEDPSRSPRPAGGQVDRAPHRTLAKPPLDVLRSEILQHLSDGVPRTFNRLTVELWDITADIAFGTVADEALWSLVGEYVEHTTEVPILFRLLPHLRGDADLRQGHIAPAPGSQMSLTFSF